MILIYCSWWHPIDKDDDNNDGDDDNAEDANVAWVEGVANIIIPRRGADTNRVEAAATRPGAIDISQKRPAVVFPQRYCCNIFGEQLNC